MDKDKNITLIFPPVYLVPKLYTSIYYLKTFLHYSSYNNVTTINHTLDFRRYLMQSTAFERLLDSSNLSLTFINLLAMQFEKLDKKDFLLVTEAKKYERLARLSFEQSYSSFVKERLKNDGDPDVESPYFNYILSHLQKNLLFSNKAIDMLLEKNALLFENFYSHYSLPAINAGSPAFIGISLIDNLQLIPAYILIRMLRREIASAKIYLGGPFFTKWYEYVIERFSEDIFLKNLFDLIDGIVLFEGEIVLGSILENLDNPPSLMQIPNLLMKKGEAICLTGLKTKGSFSFRQLPAPNFDGIDFQKDYQDIPYLISRGCYWRKCAFCKSYYIYQSKFTCLPFEKATNDIIYLINRYKTSTLHFCDEAIPLNVMAKIGRSLQANNIQIQWYGNARFENLLLKEDFCHFLKSSGCSMLMFGLESGNQRILNLMNKGIQLNKVKIILQNLKKAAIKAHMYLIFGFPTETDREAEDTINFLNDNKDYIYSIGCHEFVLEKGTPVNTRYGDFGITEIWESQEGFPSIRCFTYDFRQQVKRAHPPKFYFQQASDVFTEKKIKEFCKNTIKDCKLRQNYIVASLNYDIDEIRRGLTKNRETENTSGRFKKYPTMYLYNAFIKDPLKVSDGEIRKLHDLQSLQNSDDISDFAAREPMLFHKVITNKLIVFEKA